METLHIVQPFTRAKKGFMPRQALQFKTADEAARRAELAASNFDGVVAYSMDVDEAGGDYSAPRVLAKFGEIPEFE